MKFVMFYLTSSLLLFLAVCTVFFRHPKTKTLCFLAANILLSVVIFLLNTKIAALMCFFSMVPLFIVACRIKEDKYLKFRADQFHLFYPLKQVITIILATSVCVVTVIFLAKNEFSISLRTEQFSHDAGYYTDLLSSFLSENSLTLAAVSLLLLTAFILLEKMIETFRNNSAGMTK